MVMIPRRPGHFHALPGPFSRSWKTLAVDSVAPLPIGNPIARGVASTHDARDEAGKSGAPLASAMPRHKGATQVDLSTLDQE